MNTFATNYFFVVLLCIIKNCTILHTAIHTFCFMDNKAFFVRFKLKSANNNNETHEFHQMKCNYKEILPLSAVFPTPNFPSYVSNGLMSYLLLFLTFFPGKFCFNFDTKLFLWKEFFWLWNIWKFNIEFNINVFSELT